MLRGYRSIIAASLIGLTITSVGAGYYAANLNRPQEQRYQAYGDRSNNGPGASAAIANVANSPVVRTPCENPKTESESDLCAQWRAAKAAENGVDWTKWGVIFSVIGIIGLYWQIGLTREAVTDTGRATEAMREANRIAETAQRPWLDATIKLHGIAQSENGYILRTEIIVENIGSTPSNNLRYGLDGYFLRMSSVDIIKSVRQRDFEIENTAIRIFESVKNMRVEGATIFPKASESFFVENEIGCEARDCNYEVAWIAVCLRYSFGNSEGSTVRVFQIRSFGLPNETGFDFIGTSGHSFTETNAIIHKWEISGHAT